MEYIVQVSDIKNKYYIQCVKKVSRDGILVPRGDNIVANPQLASKLSLDFAQFLAKQYSDFDVKVLKVKG